MTFKVIMTIKCRYDQNFGNTIKKCIKIYSLNPYNLLGNTNC